MRLMVTDGRGGRAQELVVQAPAGARRRDLERRLSPGDDAGDDAGDDVAHRQTPLRHGQELWPGPGAPGETTPASHGTGGPWVVVAAGPDAGALVPLPPGRWVTVGRDPACGLCVGDPSLSRRHVRIRLDREAVHVEDLGSTNGSSWESGAISSVWRADDRLLVGRSALVLLPRLPAPVSVLERDGRWEVVPWARERPHPDPVELTVPAAPTARAVRPPSAWTWALPLVVAGAVAVVLRMPWVLLFGILGPAMVLGHHLGDRRAARSEHEEAVAVHRRQCAQIEAEARASVRRELAVRRQTDRGLVGVAGALANGPSTALWECSGEPLTVVLGEARQDADVTLDGTRLGHERAPVVVDLGSPLVVAGAPGARDALARSVVLQLAVRHPPGALVLEVDPTRAPGDPWDLLAWLPHTRLGQHAARTGPGPTEGSGTLRWGTDLVLVDDARQASPALTQVVLLGTGSAVLRRPGLPDRRFDPTMLGLRRARGLARSLAPLRAVTAGRTHEATAPPSLGHVLRWPRRPEDALELWRRPTLSVPLGQEQTGTTLTVDLAVDGPHALVAGTTGSGKSELLRTLVCALAVQNPPSDLSLLLVDYKGGSSLGACAGLPHVTGLVTDLDPHLAGRMLLSLQAELTRREHLLRAAGARDVRDYSGGGLPRLVVVIDEFRVLAEEVPEVLDGLVRVAAVGRSLGVHLVLATQRPGGVVGPDLRANVNLRIALRVRDTSDSLDVLECADAASLPEGRPGLALLRTGASPPRAVQVALARPAPREAEDGDGWLVSAHTDPWAARVALERAAHPSEREDHVLALAGVLSSAADHLGQRARPVWLPPLGEDLRSAPGAEGAWAVADLPGEQRQPPVVWSGTHHVGIVGAARSGRTTALRSLLTRSPAWTVVLDLGRSLAVDGAGPDHPRCCAWVAPDDRAHALRVLDLLHELLQQRAAEPALPREPVVLAVDGWDRLVDLLGQIEGGRGVELARRILREGPAVGVVAVVTGDRSLLLGALATLLPETWMLRLNDPSDLLLTGLRPAQVPRHQPPGRVVRAQDGVVAQVVRPLPWRVTHEVGRPDASDGVPAAGAPPFRCRSLPRRWWAEGPATWAVGGDEASPVELPSGSVLVLGPPGSGRSATLRALATAAGGASLVVTGHDPAPAEQLAEGLARLAEGELVSVDDAHLLAGTPVEDLLVAHAVRHGRMHVAADLDAATTAFRGLLPQLARARTAVVLQPRAPADGGLVGAQLPVGDLPLPGRGVLVRRGRSTRVQVARPSPPAGP